MENPQEYVERMKAEGRWPLNEEAPCMAPFAGPQQGPAMSREEAERRAHEILENIRHGVGNYQRTQGPLLLRDNVEQQRVGAPEPPPLAEQVAYLRQQVELVGHTLHLIAGRLSALEGFVGKREGGV